MSERERIYEWLAKEFYSILDRLPDEGKVDLDGILWKLSDEMAEKGFALQAE